MLLTINISLTAQTDTLFPPFDGYHILHEYPVYHGENLWDYIDGAADNYLNYHFQDLHVAEYAKGKDRIFYKVEIYRHEDPLYAFGIYSSERSPEYRFVKIGTQGFEETGQLFFLKGSHYVKVMAVNESRRGETELVALARSVAEHLPGPTAFPSELRLFPDEGKVPNSERFIASDFLGYSFFEKVFTALYRINGKEFTLFLVYREDPAKVKALLSELYRTVEGEVPKNLPEGDRILNDKYNGRLFIIWEGKLLFGFRDIDDEAVIRPLAAALLFRYRTGERDDLYPGTSQRP